MPNDTTFESFEKELNRLVESFGKRLAELKQPGYAEAQLRDDFLNPFFRALGWDMENRAGLIQREREVEIESATQIGGGRKRADYLFRADKRDRFVCEAKKPSEELNARYAFQTKRYAWNKGVWMGILTDFEEIKIYIVGSKSHLDEPHVGEWKVWHFRQYPLLARELWDLLARDKIAAGSIDQAIDALPKKAAGAGKARQQWLIKPDRNRALDSEFLEFLDATRRDLASDIYKNNDHDELLDGNKLTEACQRIIDRILFLRICEDRDIDTGQRLQSIVEKWRKNTGDEDTGRRAHQQPMELHDAPPANYGSDGIRAPKESLWPAVVRHFRALDRRPPTHVPFFNGNLFKPHFTETLIIGDEWLAGFISELSDEETPYLFNYIDVEILGSVYERFLGKVVVLKGRGISIDEKPEVRKAGGVYYTPRYIVDYIVEQTAGKLLDEIAAEKETEGVKAFATRTEKLRLLDPACGSGSFLIRAFERVCEHWQKRLTAAMPPKEQKTERTAWEKKHRPLCWVDSETSDVHLTVALKRQVLTQNIYGVDLDAAAVEVTQLSLYLKMLEHENRTTLQRQRELLADEAEIALLPPLQDNIKCGNSLIASDFSMMPEDLVRVHAFDWPVQFQSILKAGGFDAVIGNPPYVRPHNLEPEAKEYFWRHYDTFEKKGDLYCCFSQKAASLCRNGGRFSFIVSNGWLRLDSFQTLRKMFLDQTAVEAIVDLPDKVFAEAQVKTCIFVCTKTAEAKVRDTQKISVWQQPDGLETLKLNFLRAIPQKTFRTTYKEIFDISISPETEVVKDRVKENGQPLGELFDVCFGLKTGDDEKFLHHGKEKKEDKPLLRGDDVGRYDSDFKDEYVWYVPEKMRQHRQTARPGEAWRFDQPKVLIKDTTSVFAGTYDDGRYYVKDVLIVIPFKDKPAPKIALKAVLAMLNSRLLTFYYRTTFQTIHVQRNELASLPLARIDFSKPADKARHDKLVVLVDKLLGLMPKLRTATLAAEKAVLQNAVTATDQQIDALVYELYGLTAEEIKLVEGGQ